MTICLPLILQFYTSLSNQLNLQNNTHTISAAKFYGYIIIYWLLVTGLLLRLKRTSMILLLKRFMALWKAYRMFQWTLAFEIHFFYCWDTEMSPSTFYLVVEWDYFCSPEVGALNDYIYYSITHFLRCLIIFISGQLPAQTLTSFAQYYASLLCTKDIFS